MSTSLNQQEQQWLSRIDEWVAQHQQELLDDLSAWVRVPSVSRADQAAEGAPFGPACAQVLDLALHRARELGFRTETHQGYAGSIIYGDHPQEIGLVSHLDVVPEGENWVYPPFDVTRKGEFLIGRGVADNKGPAVVDLYLLRLIRDLGIPLAHNLRIIYGLAEETGMEDLSWYARNAPVPAISIVTDGRFPVNYAQKGQLTLTLNVPVGEHLANFSAGIAGNSVPERAGLLLTGVDQKTAGERLAQLAGLAQGRISTTPKDGGLWVEAQGIAGHAAFPEGTLSAVRVLFSALLEARLLKDLDRQAALFFEQALSSPYGEEIGIAFEDRPSGKLTFNAGIWRPHPHERALQVSLDIRYPVTQNAESLLAALERNLLPHGIRLLTWKDAPPFYIEENDPRVQILQQSYQAIRAGDEAPYAMGGATHSKVLPRGITFGPGYARTEKRIPDFLPEGHGYPHGADESLHLPSLLSVFPIYVLAIIRLDRWLRQNPQ
ncbi:Sapep family Mn(2+)-dependent dipeptidase [Brenneria tiliae]|uniref:Sapep family Mn(2+)-dependent dipeptidase n=1 Tax=Brenneria tiliae TaxID=2914984 RepID=A0ABT0MWG8_9GAMM|nr:Sapep family Mn(2+)-dependent dipeptidase [Brenneria tiliae]MCL2894186.1 Sapep family Mn(2+)-dependent dipeptidase [Brenneria tiliae]